MAINHVTNRILWLDWIKFFAILSVIWGHFFSDGHIYLYVFSVQVFCVVSGFLYKKAPNWKTCFRKCFCQLFIPTMIMSITMHLEAYWRCLVQGQSYDISWTWFFQWILLGHRWCMGPCWYFYSLIVMRVIMQALPDRKWVYALLFVLLSVGAISLNNAYVEISNANVNVLVCMPFFLLGVFLKPFKKKLNGLGNVYTELTLLIVAMVLVFICGQYNGYVWMYLCGYGNNFALYILGGMAGTMMLYIVSLWLSRRPYQKMVQTVSKGSILIIGLHIIIVRRLTELPNRMWCEDLIFSVLILLSFIPLIHLAEKFFPLILGHYKN